MKVTKISILFGALVVVLASCKKHPIASFTVNEGNPEAGEEIFFINNSINADSYHWDFGDNTESTKENPTHIYYVEGVYPVTLTVYSKKQKKVMNITRDIAVGDTSTYNVEENIVGLWTYDSSWTYNYMNGALQSSSMILLSDLFTIHTLEFLSNGTYEVNLDLISTGTWVALEDGEGFITDGTDTSYVSLLDANNLVFYSTNYTDDGFNVYVDSSFSYCSR